jgi:hypothetical protein
LTKLNICFFWWLLTLWILVLEGVTKHEFEHTVCGVNERLAKAEKINHTSVLENCFGALSCFLLFLCYEPQYSKVRSFSSSLLSALTATEIDSLQITPNITCICNSFINPLFE